MGGGSWTAQSYTAYRSTTKARAAWTHLIVLPYTTFISRKGLIRLFLR